MKIESLDDYLNVIDRIFTTGKSNGAVCLKSTLAYQRTLDFQNVSKERAEKAFGRAPDKLSAQERKDFEDYIMWGADCNHAEGIYGATEYTRRCISEVPAERVNQGDLKEEHALRIGKQILRDNALALFPQLKERLWKHKGLKLTPPE